MACINYILLMYVLSPYLNIYRPVEKNLRKSLLINLYLCRINLHLNKSHTQPVNQMHYQDFPPFLVDPCCKKIIYPFLLSLSLLLRQISSQIFIKFSNSLIFTIQWVMFVQSKRVLSTNLVLFSFLMQTLVAVVLYPLL